MFDFGDGSCPISAEHANSDDETQAVSEIIKQRDISLKIAYLHILQGL